MEVHRVWQRDAGIVTTIKYRPVGL